MSNVPSQPPGLNGTPSSQTARQHEHRAPTMPDEFTMGGITWRKGSPPRFEQVDVNGQVYHRELPRAVTGNELMTRISPKEHSVHSNLLYHRQEEPAIAKANEATAKSLPATAPAEKMPGLDVPGSTVLGKREARSDTVEEKEGRVEVRNSTSSTVEEARLRRRQQRFEGFDDLVKNIRDSEYKPR